MSHILSESELSQKDMRMLRRLEKYFLSSLERHRIEKELEAIRAAMDTLVAKEQDLQEEKRRLLSTREATV